VRTYLVFHPWGFKNFKVQISCIPQKESENMMGTNLKVNCLRMGFTFLMDANTSNYFYNYFMGMKQSITSH
jgi:hypothetical protein